LDERPVQDGTAIERGAARGRARWWAALILMACSGILGVAAYIHPDPRGYGTHAQLGTGQCGFLILTGYPCPTCGMTTAFAHTVRGQWWRAFFVQPAGFVLALGVIVLTGVSAWAVIRGRWPALWPPFVTPQRFFLGVLVLLLAGWIFKIVVGLFTGVLPYR
jgi:hypothetical protein